MAKEKNFVLVSLEEDKAKKLAQVISNDTCRKILDFLTKKEGTETEISTELNLPISTVHYNLKMLAESGLVVTEEYHYSKKGREILHYSLANKYIIIAPKTTEKLPAGFKHLLPVTLIVAASAFALKLFTSSQPAMDQGLQTTMANEISVPMYAKQAAAPLSEAANETIAGSPLVLNSPDITLWFIIGAVFALGVYGLYLLAAQKFNK